MKNDALEARVQEASIRAAKLEAQVSAAVKRASHLETEKDDVHRRLYSELASAKQQSVITKQALQQRLDDAIEARRIAIEEKEAARHELDKSRFESMNESNRQVEAARLETQEQRRLLEITQARLQAMEAEVSDAVLLSYLYIHSHI